MDNAHKGVLDRESAIETAKYFKDTIDLLNELLDYGTNLVPRAFVSSPRDLKAICVIFFQLRQFLVHLDGATTLASIGSCYTASLQLRSLLEISFTLEWLLKFDTKEKVHHLYVANLRKRRNWNATIAIPNSPEAARHTYAASRLNLTAKQLQKVVSEMQDIDSKLAKPPFDTINTKFQPFYTKHGYDQLWYKIYGVASIQKIAEDLGKLNEYRYHYSFFSEVTHGSDIWKSVSSGKEGLAMNPIREPQEIPNIARFASIYTLHVFRLVIREYRAAEEENFNRKYLSEWRSRFLAVFQEHPIELIPNDIII